jgi:lipopolysaccharide biosynthesis glycosyltransferase
VIRPICLRYAQITSSTLLGLNFSAIKIKIKIMAFPKNRTDLSDELNRVRCHLGKAKDSCVVVGNGPSASQPRISADTIKDSLIFRANWFFLEKEKLYGSTVDAFFWSVDNSKLRSELRNLRVRGDYRIRSYFQPFVASDSDETVKDETALHLYPQFDHWAIIAHDPVLARFMMGRPLPTQGIQMIAVAAILGFKKISVAGIDMYQDSKKRYGFDVPSEIAENLEKKDITPGYEKNHSLDNDLKYLRAIRSRYRFEFSGSPEMSVLAPFFDFARSDRMSISPQAKLQAKKAFVTLADGAHAIGAVALARSLKKVSDIPLIVMYTTESTPYFFQQTDIDNVILRKIKEIQNPNQPKQSRFLATYSKLRVFELLDYDRVVFVDADCIALKSIDDLFDTDKFCVAPDWGFNLNEYFNSGLLAFNPSSELRDLVMSKLDNASSYDGGDQGYLNAILRDKVSFLPPEYNTLKRLLVEHPNMIALADVKILHYVGVKPWEIDKGSEAYDYLDALWSRFLAESDWQKEYLIWKKICQLHHLNEFAVDLKGKLTLSSAVTTNLKDLIKKTASRKKARLLLAESLLTKNRQKFARTAENYARLVLIDNPDEAESLRANFILEKTTGDQRAKSQGRLEKFKHDLSSS